MCLVETTNGVIKMKTRYYKHASGVKKLTYYIDHENNRVMCYDDRNKDATIIKSVFSVNTFMGLVNCKYFIDVAVVEKRKNTFYKRWCFFIVALMIILLTAITMWVIFS